MSSYAAPAQHALHQQHAQNENSNEPFDDTSASPSRLNSTTRTNGDAKVEVKPNHGAAPVTILRCGDEIVNHARDIGIWWRTTLIAFTSFLGLVMAIAALAEERTNPDDEDALDNIEALYIVVTVLTALTGVLLIEFYVFEFRHRRKDCDTRKIEHVPYWRYNLPLLLIEIIVHVPHPLPGKDWDEISLYFMGWMFVRVYTILRVLAYNHMAYSMRFEIFGKQAAKFPKVDVGWPMMIKIIFLQNSGTFFLATLWYVVFWVSFTVYIAERAANQEDFEKYTHCLWFTFVTGSTIGYGDMTPFTTLGKLAAVVAGVFGVVIANMVAAILAVRFAATSAEGEILTYVLKYKSRGDLENESANVLANFLRLCVAAGRASRLADEESGGRMSRKCVTDVARDMTYLIVYRKLETSIDKAKVARNILDSLVPDDARASMELNSVLVATERMKAEQQRQSKLLSTLNASTSRQFATMMTSLAKVHAHLNKKQVNVADRVDVLEQQILSCIDAVQSVSSAISGATGRAPASARSDTPTPAAPTPQQQIIMTAEGDRVMQAQVSSINVMLKKILASQQELCDLVVR
eukprot:PhM_4_TR14095/c0_g1_i3/m.49860/K04944/KCNN3; potassium intermediate/small conductance calcium-activated channel subfamily N member 3